MRTRETYTFSRAFTAQTGVANTGQELASVLLGLPRAGAVDFDRGELEWFTRYMGAYVQDDWRVNSKFTLNFGVRLEHEDGLREIENRQTVKFDRTVVSPIDTLVNKAGTPLAGRTITGGLIYAGVNGATEEQGNLPAVTVQPRVGVAWSLTDKTVIRGGYGLFSAPWQYLGDHARADRVHPDDGAQPVGRHDGSAADEAGQPVPERPDCPGGQLAGPADRRRRKHRRHR